MRTVAFMFVSVLVGASICFAQETPTEPVAVADPATEIRQAVASAKTFAKAGKVDESLSAIREVLKDGPPVKVTFRGLFETLTGQGSKPGGIRTVTVEVAIGLWELDLLWREKQFPPEKVFDTLRTIVFPESRKTEVFTYSPLESTSAGERSAGRMLVEWAVDAGQTEELRESLGERKPKKLSPTHLLLSMQLAWAERDSSQMFDEFESMSAALKATPDVDTAVAMLPAVSIALRDADAALDALPVIEQVIDLLHAKAYRASTLELLLRSAARLQFEQGNLEAADRHLTRLLELYRNISGNSLDADAARSRVQRIASVAQEYLRGNQINRALEVTGEALATPLLLQPDSRADDGLGAVAAALNRRLMQLDAADRYQLLRKWTLPDEADQPVRILSTFAPIEAPPEAFARILGERPQSDSFAVPEIGGITGVFCSGWELAQAAHDAGYLRQLIVDLDTIIQGIEPDTDVDAKLRLRSDAQYLSRLAHIAGSRSASGAARLLQADDIMQLVADISLELDAVRNRLPIGTSKIVSVEMRDVALAAACLTCNELREFSPEFLTTLIAFTGGKRRATYLRPLLRRARALALFHMHEGASPGLFERPNLDLWVPASARDATQIARGAVPDIWLPHEDHILHVAGPGEDYLCFRYPLTGDFQLSVEAQESSFARIEGGLIYGGLCYASGTHDGVHVQGLERRAEIRLPNRFLTTLGRPVYQHLKLNVSGDGTVFSSNRHPMFRDPVSQTTSPWLGLRSVSDHDPAFRNLAITGNPVIPREVNLVAGNTLRGWLYGFYSESSPGVVVADTSISVQQGLDCEVPLADAPEDSAIQAITLIGAAPESRPTQIQPVQIQQIVDGRTVTMTVTAPVVDPRAVTPSVNYDWSAQDGVLHGRQNGRDFTSSTESRLTYFRPLQNGESLSYEFYYQSGRYEVHPAIGRLAFLIDPDGMRVHWMTTGDNEWTGVAGNNTLFEPLNRKARRLALKASDWNEVILSLDDDVLSLSVNGTIAYTRKLEPELDRAFSFYHDRNHSAAQVRNVFLRGDWPERLSAEQLAALTADSVANRTPQDRQLLGAVFADRHTQDSALDAHWAAMAMPPEQRFEYLSRWVLPGDDHDTIRIAMDFSQMHPAPPVAAMHAAVGGTSDPTPDERKSRIHMGGNAVSPALDLIRVAAELGKLKQVRDRLEAHSHTNQQQRKARAALLAVIDLHNREFDTALKSLDELFNLLETEKQVGFKSHWPETTAFAVAVHYLEAHEGIRDLLTRLILGQVRKNRFNGSVSWPRQISAYSGMLRIADLRKDHQQRVTNAGELPTVDATQPGQNVTETLAWMSTKPALSPEADLADFRKRPALKQWSPVSLYDARYRGPGSAPAVWRVVPDSSVLRGVEKVSGFTRQQVEKITNFDNDYLFFQSPLRGNYSIEAEVGAFGWREMTFCVGGRWVAPVYFRNSCHVGYLRGQYAAPVLDPKMCKPGQTFRLLADVRDGIVTTSISGRVVHQEPLIDANEPWLALRSPYRNYGVARNVRITGDPEIPDTLRLTTTDQLPGWIPYHFQSVGTARADWRQRGGLADGGGIVGRLKPEFRGMRLESAVHYHRPMLEDGRIDYEFYYRPGESDVAPIMDRMAFILDPDRGVRIHWVTDGRRDSTRLDPANIYDEPENRRGPGSEQVAGSVGMGEFTPLMPNAWNKVSLQLTGDTVHLFLNGIQVYERLLEPGNQRTFGFFHYCGQTEARVRNVTWTGDWPRELPSLAEQELAGVGAESLDARSKQLTAVFTHDFAADGLPRDRFVVTTTNMPHTLEAKLDGVHITQQGGDGYMNFTVSPKLSVSGDFDVTIDFDGFVGLPERGGKSSFLLQTVFDNDTESLLYRRHSLPDGEGEREETFSGSRVEKDGGKAERSYFGTVSSEARSGRLRLSRRGSVVYYLFSENNSQVFHLCHAAKFTDAPVKANGLRLITQSAFDCSTSVVLKCLTIRAEELSGLALEDTAPIVTGLNSKRDALAASFTHDFAKDSLADDRMSHWNQATELKPGVNGLPVTATGTKNWTACGIGPRLAVSGDFDISVRFAEVNLAQPVGDDYSGVLLNMEIADVTKSQFYVVFRQLTNGKTQLTAMHRTQAPDGNIRYDALNSVSLESASRLRTARHGTELSILYSTPDSGRDLLLSQIETGREDIVPSGIRLMLHTGAEGLESNATWQSLSIRASKIAGSAVSP